MLTFRQATYADVDLFFEWANDPVTRQNSYNKGLINYAAHVIWFQKKLEDPDARMYVFLNANNEPAGQIRIERNSTSANADHVISISIGEQHRGKGYASEMLQQASGDFLSANPNNRIIAYVFTSNEASYRSFIRSGYTVIEQKEISGVDSYILEKKNFYEK